MDGLRPALADRDFVSGVVRGPKGDRIIYENDFGYADRAWQVPNSLQTRFKIRVAIEPRKLRKFVYSGGEEA